jgi:predicted small lipoprotein YifL
MTHILISLRRKNSGFAVRRRLLMLFAVSAALALPLAACGRKGPLDPPPGGYTIEQGIGKTPTSRKGKAPEADTKQQYDEDGRPIIPEGRNRRLPADWLLD